MKKIILPLLLVILGLVCEHTNAASEKNTAPAAPLKLWYDTPATKWVEALPVGNGRLGAMVFGGAPQ
ncbi:MAG: glycoside hydrolase family 95 protein, partial [Puniceicoccales bacterium]|nr:glycoside hydrolase family 95 protein [Puniceicoccales bacterium]